MLIMVVLAFALVGGAPPWVVLLAAATLVQPLVGGAAFATAVGFSLWQRFQSSRIRISEASFFHAMASELRSGSSLRLALGGAAARQPGLGLDLAVRNAAAGQPAEFVAAELSSRLPQNGRLAGAAFELASHTGAQAADVFETLASGAAEFDELARERATLTAQARLSAAVVGGLPVLLIVGLVVTGRASLLLESGFVGWALVAVGLTLEITGVATVVFMLWRARK